MAAFFRTRIVLLIKVCCDVSCGICCQFVNIVLNLDKQREAIFGHSLDFIYVDHVRIDIANICRLYLAALFLNMHKHSQRRSTIHCNWIALQFTFIFCSGVCEWTTDKTNERKNKQTNNNKKPDRKFNCSEKKNKRQHRNAERKKLLKE